MPFYWGAVFPVSHSSAFKLKLERRAHANCCKKALPRRREVSYPVSLLLLLQTPAHTLGTGEAVSLSALQLSCCHRSAFACSSLPLKGDVLPMSGVLRWRISRLGNPSDSISLNLWTASEWQVLRVSFQKRRFSHRNCTYLCRLHCPYDLMHNVQCTMMQNGLHTILGTVSTSCYTMKVHNCPLCYTRDCTSCYTLESIQQYNKLHTGQYTMLHNGKYTTIQ